MHRGRRPSSDLRCATCALVSGALLASSGLLGCAAPRAYVRDSGLPHILAEGRSEGLSLVDPLALDPDIEEAVDRAVGRNGDPETRVRRLLLWLRNNGFQYSPARGMSLTAREAFLRRRGDCLAYSNLLVALTRRIGVESRFMHVRDVQGFYERDDSLFGSSHVAMAFENGSTFTVVDVFYALDEWRLAAFRPLEDADALALFYNNVAVDALAAGNLGDAERILRFFRARRPEVEEVRNNLAVVLLRTGRFEEALAELRGAIERVPDYKPYYTNAILAAAGAGRPDLARLFEERGEAIAGRDPLFVFASGVRAYGRRDYRTAVRALEVTRSAYPESVLVLVWVARAHLAAGDCAEGDAALARASELRPGDPRVQQLTSEGKGPCAGGER